MTLKETSEAFILTRLLINKIDDGHHDLFINDLMRLSNQLFFDDMDDETKIKAKKWLEKKEREWVQE